MCVSLSRANWLVHSHPDECTTGRAGERSGSRRRQKKKKMVRTEVMHGTRDVGENKQKNAKRECSLSYFVCKISINKSL